MMSYRKSELLLGQAELTNRPGYTYSLRAKYRVERPQDERASHGTSRDKIRPRSDPAGESQAHKDVRRRPAQAGGRYVRDDARQQRRGACRAADWAIDPAAGGGAGAEPRGGREGLQGGVVQPGDRQGERRDRHRGRGLPQHTGLGGRRAAPRERDGQGPEPGGQGGAHQGTRLLRPRAAARDRSPERRPLHRPRGRHQYAAQDPTAGERRRGRIAGSIEPYRIPAMDNTHPAPAALIPLFPGREGGFLLK